MKFVNKRTDFRRYCMQKKQDPHEIELMKSIIETKIELNMANRNFDTANDEKLIDYYSYQIKANKSKLDYLIKTVKQKGLVLDIVNELELRSYQTKAI